MSPFSVLQCNTSVLVESVFIGATRKLVDDNDVPPKTAVFNAIEKALLRRRMCTSFVADTAWSGEADPESVMVFLRTDTCERCCTSTADEDQ